jgi:hypothetical protein
VHPDRGDRRVRGDPPETGVRGALGGDDSSDPGPSGNCRDVVVLRPFCLAPIRQVNVSDGVANDVIPPAVRQSPASVRIDEVQVLI